MTTERGLIRLEWMLLAFVVALLQFRILILMFGPEYEQSVDAALGVVTGEPHWRVYQNRLLGPYLVQALSLATGSFTAAHAVCTVVVLAATGYLALVFLRRLRGDDASALAGYFAFAFLVVCCFQRPWLYIWDFLDLLVFVLFNYFVARQKDHRSFAALCVIALLNRESAWFIALWMIFDPGIKFLLGRLGRGSRAVFDLRMAVSGIALLGGGVVLVELLRNALLVREVGPSIVGNVRGAGARYHYMLQDNIAQLVTSVTSLKYALSFLIPCFLLAFVAFAARVAWRDPRGRAGLALVHLLMPGAMVVFGILFETRIYLVLLPFVVFNLDGLTDLPGVRARR